MVFRISIAATVAVASLGCTVTARHHAKIQRAPVPPPPIAMVPHSGRLWLQIEAQTPDRQCVKPASERRLCFAGVSQSIGDALERTLWPSFPRVAVKKKGDNLEPGDYVLLVQLTIDALPADATGPGWSAAARGNWRLVRDGLPIAGETFASRSRAEFPYGRALGVGGGEVVNAIGVHIASVIGQLPEPRPIAGVMLPAVSSEPKLEPQRGETPKLSASRE